MEKCDLTSLVKLVEKTNKQTNRSAKFDFYNKFNLVGEKVNEK